MKQSRFFMVVISLTLFSCQALFSQEEDDEWLNSWDIPYLDAARNVSYLSDIEKDVVLELNKLRSNPPLYARRYLEPLRSLYKENIFTYPDTKVQLETEEGLAALNECIQVLKQTKEMKMLHPSYGLSMAARKLAKEQGRNGRVGHKGRKGSTPFSRMNEYGKWLGTSAENIDYGNESARWILISLLIDDGVKERGHRITMLYEGFGKVGVAVGEHPKYKHMCVMDFAENYLDQQ